MGVEARALQQCGSAQHCLNPIGELFPPEILAQIFLYSLAYSSPPLRTQAPINVSHTCARWREAALSTPALWSFLQVDVVSAVCRPAIPFVEIWLGRSGDSPLTLALTWKERRVGMLGFQLFRAALQAFLQHHHRWRSLRIPVRGGGPFFPDQPISVPLLESLQLDVSLPTVQVDAADYQWLSSAVASAPLFHSLTTIDNELLHISWDLSLDRPTHHRFSNLVVPWSQLTSIRLETTISIIECLDIMSQAINLVHCTFSSVYAEYMLVPSHQTMSLRRLRSLRYSPPHRQLPGAFFDHLILPELQILDIHANSPIDGLRGMVTRSSCSITTLIMRLSHLYPRGLYSILDLLSASLRTLVITSDSNWQKISPSTVRRLTHGREPESTLCPRLERLVLHCLVGSRDGELSDMVESRWRIGHASAQSAGGSHPSGVTPLLHFGISDEALSNGAHTEDMKRLRHLFDQEGLGGSILTSEKFRELMNNGFYYQ